MARKVIGMTRKVGRTVRQRRWAALLSLVVLVSAGLVLQAVHDLDFELDGDIDTDGSTPFNSPTIDWASLFDADGNTVDPLPGGGAFTHAAFSRDFVLKVNGDFATTDNTTFATGSKDTLPISTGWQCNQDANVNSKIDIMNAYAAAYTDPFTGDQILYFGLERNANEGDANVAFWFLQDDVGCVSTGGAESFVGDHRDGDLLIVSAFTNGGTVSTIDVYRWNIPDPLTDPIGSLGTTPVAHGVDCRDPATGTNDTACATANTGTISSIPWLTAAKQDHGAVGHSLPTAQFFEGGLNLTDSGLGGKCFNVFIGDTRSSQSLTATLFDFARGVIGECTSETATTPNISAPTIIPGDPLDASVDVTDTALVTVDGAASFDGSVSWHLCGPSDPTGTGYTCATGGVDVGSQSTTSQSSPWTVVSPQAFVTAAGRYCWRAEFHATAPDGIPDSTDDRPSECFVILPRQPTLTTQATTGPVDFGDEISDTVTLGNTAHQEGTGGPTGSDGSINAATLGDDAGGNITVIAYGPDSCTTVAFTSNPIGVIGNGVYGGPGTNFEFEPTAPGQYVFVAVYTGDPPNTLGAGASGQTPCEEAPDSEKVTVRQIPTEIKTKQSWIPNDTATIRSTIGNLVAGGTAAFSLYDNATCTGTALFSQSVTVPGGAQSAEVSTTNTTFVIVTGYTDPADSLTARYSWKIVYTPGAADTAHTGIQSACDAEHFRITYTNDPGPAIP